MKASRQNLLYIGGGIIAVCLIYLCFFRKTSEGFADDNKVDEGVVNIIVNAINDIANKKPEYAEMITKIYNDSKIKAIVSKVESKPADAAPVALATATTATTASTATASAPSPSVDPTLSAASTFSAAALPEPMPSAAAAAELPEPAILEPEAPSESPDSNYFDDDDDLHY